MTPEFSPQMLKFFLQVRVGHALRTKGQGACTGPDRAEALAIARRMLRRRAGVTATAFDLAWHGRLRTVAPRLKLWAALGLVPGDFGVMRTDDGCQDSNPAPKPLPTRGRGQPGRAVPATIDGEDGR